MLTTVSLERYEKISNSVVTWGCLFSPVKIANEKEYYSAPPSTKMQSSLTIYSFDTNTKNLNAFFSSPGALWSKDISIKTLAKPWLRSWHFCIEHSLNLSLFEITLAGLEYIDERLEWIPRKIHVCKYGQNVYKWHFSSMFMLMCMFTAICTFVWLSVQ